MKKFYLMALVAMTVMAMSSCSSDEPNVGPEFSTTPIGFGSYVGRDAETRATVALKGVNDFGVFAFYTGNKAWADYTSKDTPNFMNNQKVVGTPGKSDKDNWSYTYDPVKYWPNNEGDKLSFFAYAPYDATMQWNYNAADPNKGSYLACTVPSDVKNQKDFLVCLEDTKKRYSTIDLTKPLETSQIEFRFKHAMARICFKVAYAKDDITQNDTSVINDKETTVKIDSVKIGDANGVGFFTKGNLSFGANVQTITWNGSEGKQGFALTSSNFDANVADKVTNDYQILNGSDSYLMVIPQDFTSNGFPIEVVYTVTTKDNNVEGGEVTTTNTIKKTVNVNFEAGKAYSLQLLLGLTDVKTSATVGTWENEGKDTIIDLPQNKDN